ncbi:MAG: uracil-DNA glycosylase [Anaerolineaceae bacterium]
MNDFSNWEDLNDALVNCRLCPRLVEWREKMAREKRRAFQSQEYWGKPVPGFGAPDARVMVLGLAPGAHGSNRTGRMFTGDASGEFLYAALHRAGFANQPASSDRNDNLKLNDLFITAVCRCAPPDNKPARIEIDTCHRYWSSELALLPNLQGIVALGRIAFDEIFSMLKITTSQRSKYPFSHGAFYSFGEESPWLLASYHPSRQNTQTGRLTREMFDAIWEKVRNSLI